MPIVTIVSTMVNPDLRSWDDRAVERSGGRNRQSGIRVPSPPESIDGGFDDRPEL